MGARWAAIGIALSLGCARGAVRAAVEGTAAAVEDEMVAMRQAEDRLAARAEELYAHLDRLDLSVDHLDVEHGGQFGSFNGDAYYLKKVRAGACYYASTGHPPDDELRREIKAMTYLEDDLIAASGSPPRFVFFGVASPHSVAVMYPFLDVASVFPPGLRLEAFEWYQRGASRPGAAHWSPRPFTSLISDWIIDVSRAVQAGGQVKGVVVINVALSAVTRRHLKERPERLLLVAPDLTVVGASPAGKQAFPVPMLEDPDALRQTDANHLAADGLRLSDPSQDPGVREIARRIAAGEREFRGAVAGREHRFFVAPVPEIGFWVVGLSD